MVSGKSCYWLFHWDLSEARAISQQRCSRLVFRIEVERIWSARASTQFRICCIHSRFMLSERKPVSILWAMIFKWFSLWRVGCRCCQSLMEIEYTCGVSLLLMMKMMKANSEAPSSPSTIDNITATKSSKEQVRTEFSKKKLSHENLTKQIKN